MTDRRVARWLILGAGWGLALLYAYPGLLSPDSFAQLIQARGGDRIGDWHPPVMAVMWRYLDRVVAGPLGMLLVQTGTFLFGLDALLRRALRPATAAAIAAAILLWPPVLATMAMIWKDSQMAGFLLAGTALIVSPRRGHRIAGLGLLGVATAMRYNAAAATLPLIALLLDEHPRRWARYAIAAAAWLAITAAALGLNAALTERHEHAWHGSLALYDIAGAIRFADAGSDADLERDLAGTPLAVHDAIAAHVRAAYTTSGHHALTHGPERIFDLPSDDQMPAIAAAWRAVVTRHPLAYAEHRLAVFGHLIGLTGPLDTPLWRWPPAKDIAAALHIRAEHTVVQRRVMPVFQRLVGTWVFFPHTYLVLALALLPLCRSRLAAALLLSGLGYELGLLIAAPSPDCRYSHWLLVTTLAGAVVIFQARRSRPSGDRAPPRPE